MLVWIALKLRCVYECYVLFSFFFFFFIFTRFWRSAATVQWTVTANVDFFSKQCIRALFTDPQISFFINFFIKNGSHGIIYTFKNYFTTVISVISFQFQQNKSYPNRPIVHKWSIGEHELGCTLSSDTETVNLQVLTYVFCKYERLIPVYYNLVLTFCFWRHA